MELFNKIANFIGVKALLTLTLSVDSWGTIVFIERKSGLYDNSDYEYNIDDTNIENTPVLNQTIPAEKSLENTGGTLESIIQNSWSHYRSLEDQQLLQLAEEIVKQIKAEDLSYHYHNLLTEKFQREPPIMLKALFKVQ